MYIYDVLSPQVLVLTHFFPFFSYTLTSAITAISR